MIYGTLPFTTEKITYKEFTLADGTKKNAVVAYSIGNLLCHPTVSGSQVTQESLILNVNVERDASGKPVITAVSYVPIYTMAYQQSNKTYMYRILPSAVYAQAATQPEDIPSQDEWTKCKMAFIDIKKVVESTSGNLAIQLVDQ